MNDDIIKKVKPDISKIVTENNLNLYDLEYVKEDGNWILRVSIEKKDGSMDFETAEFISNLVSKKLDEIDPIDHSYILDVCSPGIEKPLNNKQDFINNLNNYITVYLKKYNKGEMPSYTGDLIEVNDDDILISYKDKTRTKQIKISFDNIQKAHIAVKF